MWTFASHANHGIWKEIRLPIVQGETVKIGIKNHLMCVVYMENILGINFLPKYI
jgi:hypothetical protein